MITENNQQFQLSINKKENQSWLVQCSAFLQINHKKKGAKFTELYSQLESHRSLGYLVSVLLVFPVSSLQLEHLQDAGSSVQSCSGAVTGECLKLQSEGDTSLSTMLLRCELC